MGGANNDDPANSANTGEDTGVARVNGRFAKGHKPLPGAGRPKRIPDANAKLIVFGGTEREWTALHRAIWKAAIDGSAAHARLIAEFNFAKPTDRLVVQQSDTAKVTHRVQTAIVYNEATATGEAQEQLASLLAARTKRNGDGIS